GIQEDEQQCEAYLAWPGSNTFWLLGLDYLMASCRMDGGLLCLLRSVSAAEHCVCRAPDAAPEIGQRRMRVIDRSHQPRDGVRLLARGRLPAGGRRTGVDGSCCSVDYGSHRFRSYRLPAGMPWPPDRPAGERLMSGDLI